MALKNVKVVELLGLAPAPFCGMVLADFGASVTIVDKIQPQGLNVLGNGKKHMSINLKEAKGKQLFRELCKSSDVLIEPFRAGVMEKMNLGPNVLMKDNPRLVYARLTGYGQYGEMHQRAGHDINYVSLSGVLSLLGRKDSNPHPPINLAADFAGGGLMCALGIVMALFERTSSHKGQIIDASMVEGTAYLSSWLFRSQQLPIWGNARGENILDGGAHFYDTYKTKDGKYLSVGAIEPQFYKDLMKGLEITDDDQYTDTSTKSSKLTGIFLKRTQKEWCDIFEKTDACVTPVLTLDDAPLYPHNKTRKSFVKSHHGQYVPSPAPHLYRTPGLSQSIHRPPHHGEHTMEILKELNYSISDIKQMHDQGIIFLHTKSNL